MTEGKKVFNTEVATLQADFFKHITTLSTGSIVIIVTFLEKLFSSPEWKFLIVISLIGFLLSIVGAIAVHLSLIGEAEGSFEEETSSSISQFFFYIIFGGFLIGLLSLVAFFIKNFF